MSKKIFKVIGLMSGTSMDGIDVAIIETDGRALLSAGKGITFPYTESFRNRLRDLIAGKGDSKGVSIEITKLHSDAVAALLNFAGENRDSIDLIGFHGHTVDHRPHEKITVQIGDGRLLSKLTGITVVNDFRSNDVRSGGQGAPLVPIFHQSLMTTQQKPIAIINIGGVANVTWIGENENELLAFDTGPGNALLDDWMLAKTGKNFDEGGKLSKCGVVDKNLLKQLMQDIYFSKKPPKSLDRNHFKGIPTSYSISVEDGAATLAAFTAESIIQGEKYFPKQVSKLLIAGGGRHNVAIIDYLKEHSKTPVIDIDEIGFSGDMLEAQAFAFLAVRSFLGLPISFPGTTGVHEPTIGGVLNDFKDPGDIKKA